MGTSVISDVDGYPLLLLTNKLKRNRVRVPIPWPTVSVLS